MKQQPLVYSKRKQQHDHIAIGSFYEVDHSKLPLTAPQQLNLVKLIMVNDKTESEVSLRFPSIRSLRAYFGDHRKSNFSPELDEKHVMYSDIAAEVLLRRVTAEELVDRKGSWEFWAVLSTDDPKMGSCWSEVNGSGMLHWATRCKVRFLRRDEESVVDEGGDEVKVEPKLTREPRKRKTESEDGRKVKHISRWSAHRYNLGKENVIKVLRENNAVSGNPIMRPALRSEARKLVRDTGLLDHLLKDMAGKVAPGGNERFVRRRNADGAMEYWLESADLMNIRKEAGVQDPYWIPPPGWKPGDNPALDPGIAREIKQLKKEMHKMMGFMEEMTIMKEEMKKLVTEKQSQDVTVVTTQSFSAASNNTDQDDALAPLKGQYLELLERKAKVEERLTQLSKSLSQMEEEMGKLIWNVQDKNWQEPTSVVYTADQETKSEDSNKAVLVLAAPQDNANKGILEHATEDKATKIERLKSGFKLCKPKGTILWPNMAMSPLNIYTPPSASTSTSLPQLLQDAHVKAPDINLNEMPFILDNNDG